MLQFAVPDGGGADYKTAIADGLFDLREFLGFGQKRGCAHGGHGFTKRALEGCDDAQIECAEIAHGARGSADVERVAGADQDDAEIFKMRGSGQGEVILREGMG